MFLFTVHFFNNHFRPDRFPPPDISMFTGAVSLEEFRREHTLDYDELAASGGSQVAAAVRARSADHLVRAWHETYALPALVAIGQARHHFAPSRNPAARFVRHALRARTLDVPGIAPLAVALYYGELRDAVVLRLDVGKAMAAAP